MNTRNIGNEAKTGDALGNASASNPGCAGWHSATYNNWVQKGWAFVRGAGGIFSYDNLGRYAGAGPIYCRGVATCGAEL